jgi:hypothetical protein
MTKEAIVLKINPNELILSASLCFESQPELVNYKELFFISRFVLAWCSVHAASHHSKEGEWKYSFVLKKRGRKNSREFS